MEMTNIQVVPEASADPNDFYPYNNEPAREESGDALISATASVQVKKRLIFREDEDEANVDEAEPDAATEVAEPNHAEEQLNQHLDQVLSGVEAPEVAAARESGGRSGCGGSECAK